MNCIIVDDDEFARKDLEHKVQQTVALNLVGSYGSAIEASNATMTLNVDLIFLDVVMPDMTGIEFIRSLTTLKPEIILVSGDAENAVQGFDYNVTDFLVKPVGYDRFLMAVAKAKKNHDKKGTVMNAMNDHVFIKVSSRLIKLELRKVCYIEALSDYITIHMGDEKYTVLSTMKRIEDLLTPFGFVRVHNSFIINLKHVSSIEGNSVVINKMIIPVSRNRLKSLLNLVKLI